MSASAILLIILLAWLAIGVVASIVMGRRGHAPFTWGILGALLGPLVIPLAVESIHRERGSADPVQEAGVGGQGKVDVLVGVDGSAASDQALRSVVELLGPVLGRLTLATVLDFEAGGSAPRSDERRLAESNLAEATADAAAVWSGGTPGRVVLAGQPADALIRHATEHGYSLIAIGCRGHGGAKVAFGSVASQLARSTDVPVYIVNTKGAS